MRVQITTSICSVDLASERLKTNLCVCLSTLRVSRVYTRTNVVYWFGLRLSLKQQATKTTCGTSSKPILIGDEMLQVSGNICTYHSKCGTGCLFNSMSHLPEYTIM